MAGTVRVPVTLGVAGLTDEPGQDGETPPRRKFDDVASLFGTIVPTPGAAPRLVSGFRAPTPPPPAPAPEPPAPVPALRTAVERTPEPRPEPKPAPRPRPTEVPWPDAFEPRPNFRRREPRNWTWLLLIPVGFIAAVGITTLDPRTIRNWLETHVLHRTPIAATTEAPLLSPFPSDPAPAAAAPPAEAPNPYPAIPTSPVPVPPGAEVSPPPVDPAEAAANAAIPIHITIQYRRNIPGSDGEARRIAALLQSYGGSIELHPNVATVRVPTINYYNPSDKAAAAALATALSNEAANWTVRAGTGKNPPGTLDIWLP